MAIKNGDYEREYLPPVNGGGITVEIKYHRKYVVEPIAISDEEKKEAKIIEDRPFDIDTLLACFLVKKAGSDTIEYDFNPPLQLIITYPDQAWKNAIKGDSHHPRLAYLGRKDTSWVDEWIEFTKEITAIIPPDMCDNSDGQIYLTVENLPDPLIGGC